MTDYIPDQYAQIFWNQGDDGKTTDLCIIDCRDREMQRGMGERYENSGGADTSGWLTHAHPYANPAGLFASLAFGKGFASRASAIECVREFAQLDGCEWARRMSAAVVTAES